MRGMFQAPATERAADDLALRLTLALFALHGTQASLADLPVRFLAVLMLVSGALFSARLAWLVLAGFLITGNAASWFAVDNHQYLFAYWAMACTLAVASERRSSVLAWNARLLIGLVFLLALVWKGAGGQLLDGSFMHHTLLTDGRFEGVATRLGGLDAQALAQNRLDQRVLGAMARDGLAVQLSTTPRILLLARVTSLWVLLVESLVAVGFLFPGAALVGRFRDALLMVFVVSTYFLVPVIGFGVVLLVMGFAQRDPRSRWAPIAYLVLMAAVEIRRMW